MSIIHPFWKCVGGRDQELDNNSSSSSPCFGIARGHGVEPGYCSIIMMIHQTLVYSSQPDNFCSFLPLYQESSREQLWPLECFVNLLARIGRVDHSQGSRIGRLGTDRRRRNDDTETTSKMFKKVFKNTGFLCLSFFKDSARVFRRQLEEKRAIIENNLLTGRQHLESNPAEMPPNADGKRKQSKK